MEAWFIIVLSLGMGDLSTQHHRIILVPTTILACIPYQVKFSVYMLPTKSKSVATGRTRLRN